MALAIANQVTSEQGDAVVTLAHLARATRMDELSARESLARLIALGEITLSPLSDWSGGEGYEIVLLVGNQGKGGL